MAKNAKVYMGVRDSEKTRNAIKKLKEETGKDVTFIPLDLSDLKQVRKAAESFLRLETFPQVCPPAYDSQKQRESTGRIAE